MTESQRIHNLMADGKARTIPEIAELAGVSKETATRIVYNLRGCGRLEAGPKLYQTTGKPAPRNWGVGGEDEPAMKTGPSIMAAWSQPVGGADE